MVSKKSFGPPLFTKDGGHKRGGSNPPYPTSPTDDSAKTTASTNSIYSPDLSTSPAFDLVDRREARQRPRSDSDASSHGTWDSDDDDFRERETQDEASDIPKPLQVGGGKHQQAEAQQHDGQKDGLPPSLRPGPADGGHGRKSEETQRYETEAQANPWADQQQQSGQSGKGDLSNNPYLAQNGLLRETSAPAWEESNPPAADPPAPPANAPPAPPPVELPTMQTPVDEMSMDSMRETLPPVRASWETAEVLNVPQQGQSPFPHPSEQGDKDRQSQRPTSTWWQPSGQQQSQQSDVYPQSSTMTNVSQHQQEQPYSPPSGYPPQQYQSYSGEQQYGPPPDSSPGQHPGYPQHEGHEQGQHFSAQLDPSSPQQQNFGQQPQYAPPPGSPPRQQQSQSLIDAEVPPPGPSRPIPAPIATSQPADTRPSVPMESPGTKLKQQRNEHYSIKNINWMDERSHEMRRSPILTQNANGPCPLLALVNALVLSTPHGSNTALIETLRSREQVSLGLLLDAVFDELMSNRMSEAAHDLPDVSELYSFLIGLHTGMNVNPRFVTPVNTPRGSLDGHPPEMTGIHPMHRSQFKPGVFEETKEMRLYSTFSIPLIHGWTVPIETPAYEAFLRSAQTFEDAQNIQFVEPELEDKLRSEGLTPTEQQTLQDVQTIKAFLSSWPTQLTDHGLDTIFKSLQPGQVAILFRNDHFSTIYKEPRQGTLMTLVTDAGYSSHEEIVWESLVDVNGARSEMFSGDFRAVSHSHDVSAPAQGGSAHAAPGWQNAPSTPTQHQQPQAQQPPVQEQPPALPGPRPGTGANTSPNPNTSSWPTPTHPTESTTQPQSPPKTREEEDHDFALALQLQEEEENQHREAESRRRREQELSEQYLSSQPTSNSSPHADTGGQRPPIPPRRSGANNNRTSTSTRPATNRPADAEGGTDAPPPPSYEQAASDRPYRPSGSTADPAQGNPLGAYDALQQQQQQQQGRRPGRRQSQGGQPPGGYPQGQGGRVSHAAGVRDAEERCVVM